MKKFNQSEINREKVNHARVTDEGRKLGETMARLADIGEQKLIADDGEAPQRCKTCAFTRGTVPNGCPITQCDVAKATFEGKQDFKCHVKRDGKLPTCAGWVCARVGMREMGIPDREISEWEYSHKTGLTKP